MVRMRGKPPFVSSSVVADDGTRAAEGGNRLGSADTLRVFTDPACGRGNVSAVADPNTGVWTYYSGGWYINGGTSVAAPIVASVYALAGDAASLNAGRLLGIIGEAPASDEVRVGSTAELNAEAYEGT